MLALLLFSTIFLIITLINYKMMQKSPTPGSTCPNEYKEVKNNWKWHKIFLYGSILGIIIGTIGCLLGIY